MFRRLSLYVLYFSLLVGCVPMVKSQVFDVVGSSSIGGEWSTFKSTFNIPSVVENVRIFSPNSDVARPNVDSPYGVRAICWSFCGYRILERPRSVAIVPHNSVAVGISKVTNQKIFSAPEKPNPEFVTHIVGGSIACVFKNCLESEFKDIIFRKPTFFAVSNRNPKDGGFNRQICLSLLLPNVSSDFHAISSCKPRTPCKYSSEEQKKKANSIDNGLPHSPSVSFFGDLYRSIVNRDILIGNVEGRHSILVALCGLLIWLCISAYSWYIGFFGRTRFRRALGWFSFVLCMTYWVTQN